jgi:hypothetical protein
MWGIIVTSVIVTIVMLAIAVSWTNAKTGGIKDRLQREGFTDSFISVWDYSFVAVSFDRKAIAIGREQSMTICEFSKIVQVDLLTNDRTIASNQGSALARATVGGVLFGGAGAMVGAISSGSSSTAKTAADKISLRVITDTNAHTVTFLSIANTKERAGLDSIRSIASSEADRWYGVLLNAMKQSPSKNSAAKAISSPEILIQQARSQNAPTSLASELERLWHLKESGALSADEYEKAKQSAIK